MAWFTWHDRHLGTFLWRSLTPGEMSDSYIASQGEKVSLKRSQTKNCLITMSTAQIVTVKNIFNLYPHQARERTTIVTIPKLVEFAKPKPNLDLHFKIYTFSVESSAKKVTQKRTNNWKNKQHIYWWCSCQVRKDPKTSSKKQVLKILENLKIHPIKATPSTS